MECPFVLPVQPKDSWEIIDKDGSRICLVNTTEQRDYIVQAINSHEKLKEYARHKKDCRKGWHIHLSGEEMECTCGFEQALKEAGKQ